MPRFKLWSRLRAPRVVEQVALGDVLGFSPVEIAQVECELAEWRSLGFARVSLVSHQVRDCRMRVTCNQRPFLLPIFVPHGRSVSLLTSWVCSGVGGLHCRISKRSPQSCVPGWRKQQSSGLLCWRKSRRANRHYMSGRSARFCRQFLTSLCCDHLSVNEESCICFHYNPMLDIVANGAGRSVTFVDCLSLDILANSHWTVGKDRSLP